MVYVWTPHCNGMEHPIGLIEAHMDKKKSKIKILIVDDEAPWLLRLSSVVSNYVSCETVLLDSYEAADRYVTSGDLTTFSAAIIDIRLRKQIYDQGGLTILDLIKDRHKGLPVLLLTAYSYDYPGLRETAQRYQGVLTYDKDTFGNHPESILTALLTKLPPQIGDHKMQQQPHASARSVHNTGTTEPNVWREVLAGGLIVGFVLSTALFFFMLANRFASFSWQLDVLFAVLMVVLLAVLLRLFKPSVVHEAVKIYKDLFSMGKAGRVKRKP